jgi:1-deoxy-D-xylulose 5-phosphate reductoisomerase
LITGSIGKSCLQVGEAHREADTFAILAHAAWDKLEWAVATFDYVLILQETYAAGAWITGESAQLGSVIGVDLVTWSMFIVQIVLVAAATALGTMLTWLTG